ncbi:MAG: response regulator [Terracidiphilus sp.]|jgi:CheY-like chemotaxis protein
MMNGRPISPVVPIDEAPPADTSSYKPVVLVVDDESVIADTVAAILSRNGYVAMTAYDGEEALETALLAPPEMLITDVILPGMNGIELAVKIRRIFPDCKVLLFSGQAAASDLLAPARQSGHHFHLLSKPVHPNELLAYVSQSLGRVSAAAR